MRRLVEKYIETEGLLARGDTVFAGVSGGADSVCLFLLLEEICQKKGVLLEVIHVNHGIRGGEADGDEAFVAALCEEKGVPCHVERVDVPKLAKERKMGLEEAGRLARRRACLKWAGAGGGRAKVALGHHRDDLAETALFSLIRGTGLSGLCGIRSKSWINEKETIHDKADHPRNQMVSSIEVIRPLLCVTKKQIEKYLRLKRQEWREDSSNLNQEYTRNKLRHNIIPALEEAHSGAKEHIAQAAEMMGRFKDFMDSCSQKALEDCQIFPEPSVEGGFPALDRRKLAALDGALRSEVLRRWIGGLGPGGLRDLSHTHLEAVEALAAGETGRRADLPGRISVESCYDRLILREKPGQEGRGDSPAEVLWIGKPPLGGTVEARYGGYSFCFHAEEWASEEAPSKEAFRKESENFFSICLDYDRIGEICVCFPTGGERMAISKDGRMKKLSRLFIDEKVPRSERAVTPLVYSGEDLVWAVGVRDCPLYFLEEGAGRALWCRAERIAP